MAALSSRKSAGLIGRIRVPGDKSISHRALIMGGLAIGESVVHGLLEGDDVLCTAAAMRAFGAEVTRDDDGAWHIHGRGVGGLDEPSKVLDLGNSGTGVRLLMGVAGGNPITTFFTGDGSLVARPMARVSAPLEQMGIRFVARDGGRLPLACLGPETLLPIEYTLPMASAQVKSAILLAGLAAPGETTVIEPHPTRDHTETMLRQFGATVRVEDRADGARVITITGEPELAGQVVQVPADPSSAAFPAVAALITKGSELQLERVGINPLRFGLFEVLTKLGADITVEPLNDHGGEPLADLTVRSSTLTGIEVPAEIAPRMIDEYPILAVAAAFAHGPTVMNGLAELRVKESDRLDATARGLTACGIEVEETADRLVVHGTGGQVLGGGVIAANLDHRIAMSFLTLGLGAENPVSIDDSATIDTSFPNFVALMQGVGAVIDEGETS
ncbi:MAG: 3-phosphoshikimate 1-carboxyvinyltransferase [Alphaproteobacteria bacterium]|nr:3-phosphoshikimate 1-carboxyvinyltransferase [Alphaproteobacteria bacterium]